MTDVTWTREQWRDAEAEAAAQARATGEAAEIEEFNQSKSPAPNFFHANLLDARAALWEQIANLITQAIKPLP